MMQTIHAVYRRIKGRVLPGQWLGNLLLVVLAGGWLQIPDSHAWQFVFSMISGLLLLAAFLWLYVATFRHLRSCARPPWWQSCLLLAGGLILWWLLLRVMDAGRAREAIFAGYWNSQSPSGLRSHFGYSSLVAWQEHIYDGAEYLLAGLLLPPAVEFCACGWLAASFKRAVAVYLRWMYWFCVLVFGFAGSILTWALADWTPSAGLFGQTFSIIARLGVAYTLDILLWCLLLGLISHYLEPEI
jgi:hypothetical protein